MATLKVMGSSGHTIMEADPTDEVALAEMQVKVDQLTERGFQPYRITKKGKVRPVSVVKPDSELVIAVPLVAG